MGLFNSNKSLSGWNLESRLRTHSSKDYNSSYLSAADCSSHLNLHSHKLKKNHLQPFFSDRMITSRDTNYRRTETGDFHSRILRSPLQQRAFRRHQISCYVEEAPDGGSPRIGVTANDVRSETLMKQSRDFYKTSEHVSGRCARRCSILYTLRR